MIRFFQNRKIFLSLFQRFLILVFRNIWVAVVMSPICFSRVPSVYILVHSFNDVVQAGNYE